MTKAEAFRPGRLWSLWDMIETHGDALYLIGQSLALIRSTINHAPMYDFALKQAKSAAVPIEQSKQGWLAKKLAPRPPIRVDEELEATTIVLEQAINRGKEVSEQQIESTFHLMAEQFVTLDLRVSLVLLERMCSKYVNGNILPILPDIDELNSRIQDELGARKFLAIETSFERAYKAGELLFGPEVAETFPQATFDLSEAGKCLALGRSTACVFHLMRVVEIGMRGLCEALGTTFPDNGSWNKVLNEKIGPAIEALPTALEADRERRKELSEARAHLHAIRLAWRNDTMHPKATYTEEEAGKVLQHVETFMKHLAGRLTQ